MHNYKLVTSCRKTRQEVIFALATRSFDLRTKLYKFCKIKIKLDITNYIHHSLHPILYIKNIYYNKTHLACNTSPVPFRSHFLKKDCGVLGYLHYYHNIYIIYYIKELLIIYNQAGRGLVQACAGSSKAGTCWYNGSKLQ